jgi:cyanophycin synthetase
LADYLGVYGLAPDSPVPDGLCIELCGEEQEVIDVTDDIHPSWCSVAERACGLLGVDVGGVDFRGPREAFLTEAPASAVLLEVNVLPALHLHALPTQGRPRKVFEAFVAYCLSMPGAPLPAANVQV